MSPQPQNLTNQQAKLKWVENFGMRTPFCLIFVHEYALKLLLWENKIINIDGEKLPHLKFAGDIIFVIDNLRDAKQMLEDTVNKASSKVGLERTKVKDEDDQHDY